MCTRICIVWLLPRRVSPHGSPRCLGWCSSQRRWSGSWRLVLRLASVRAHRNVALVVLGDAGCPRVVYLPSGCLCSMRCQPRASCFDQTSLAYDSCPSLQPRIRSVQTAALATVSVVPTVPARATLAMATRLPATARLRARTAQ